MTKQQWRVFISRLAIGYSIVCVALYFQQQRLMFFPAQKLDHPPNLYQLPYEDVAIPVGEQQLHGWWMPATQPDAPVILYCHHNGINIGANVSQARQFHELGYTVLLFDYRGYGQSEGAFPSEPQVYEDAQAAWEYVIQERGIKPDRVIIYGHSIGGAMVKTTAAVQPSRPIGPKIETAV
jgi:uncharacterized protein